MASQESDVNVFSTNLILIGMPGAGKSTIGLLLAKELAKNFIDTDILIQLREGKTLQDILHEHGYQRLRDIEEEILLSVKCSNHIIATGGSAVYSEAGMKHLNSFGPVIFWMCRLRYCSNASITMKRAVSRGDRDKVSMSCLRNAARCIKNLRILRLIAQTKPRSRSCKKLFTRKLKRLPKWTLDPCGF